MLTQTYHFPQANLSMEGLEVVFFDIFGPCQPWQDDQVDFLLLLLYFAEYQLQRVGRRRMQLEDSSTLPHFQLDRWLSSVYCQISTMKICVHLAAHRRAVNCCILVA